MGKILLFLSLTFLSIITLKPAFSQNDEKSTLIGNVGSQEFAMSICADQAGNKYIGGESDKKGLVVKQNALNVIQWSKTLAFTSSPNDQVNITFLDIVGDTVFGCGKIYDDPASVGKGSFYFKMNAQTGALYWSKVEISGANYLSCMRYSNGKFFLVGGGYYANSNFGGRVLAVSSQTGLVIWQNSGIQGVFTVPAPNSRTLFLSATEMVNGKMFITGSVTNYNVPLQRPILIGMDENGTIFLQKYVDVPSAVWYVDDYVGQRIEYDQDQNLVFIVSDNVLNITLDPFFVKCDTLGNLIFAKRYGLPVVSYKFLAAVNETATHYVLYGCDWGGQSLYVAKVFKNGTFDKCVSISKPNASYIVSIGLDFVMGNSTFLNGLHYFAAAESATSVFDMDISPVILDEDLNMAEGCSEIVELPFVATDLPVTMTPLGINLIPVPLTYSNGVTIQDQPFDDPCANVFLNLVQNPGCQTIVTANTLGFTDPTFYWSNGTSGTSNSLAVNTSDTVIVRVLDTKCCELIDTIVPVLAPSSFVMNLPADTSVCIQTGNSFIITPVFSGANGPVTYSWSNNSTGPSLNITQSGTYWVDVADSCVTLRDSIVVNVYSLPVIGSTANVTACENSFPVSLNPSVSAGASIIWEDGSTAIPRSVSGPGIYTLTASNFCGTTNASITVFQTDLPVVSLVSLIDTCIPNGGIVTLNPVFANTGNILWSNGSTGNQLLVSSSGTYTVYASNGCGIDSATVLVTLKHLPIIGNTAGVSVCEGSFPAIISPTVSAGANVLWDDGTTTVNRSVNGPGLYSISATNSCGTVNASISVTQLDLPDVQLISLVDTCLYSGGNVVLVPAFSDVNTILWSDGSTGNQLLVFNSGSYTVYGSNTCGIDSASCSVTINHFPELNLPTYLDTCFDIGVGFSYTAQGSSGSYQWSSGSQNAMEWISQEGVYSCTLTNQCGSITDSMQVRRLTDIDLYFPEDSIKACEKQLSVSLLHVETNYNLEIFAPDGGLVGTHLSESGWYRIHAFNACNEKWDSIYVNLQNEQYFYLPNSFTPNGDLNNEYFEFKGDNIVVREIRIFNRWGEEIFTEVGKFTGWDGTYQGQICPDGIYSVHVIYEDCFGLPTVFKGHVNLVR